MYLSGGLASFSNFEHTDIFFTREMAESFLYKNRDTGRLVCANRFNTSS